MVIKNNVYSSLSRKRAGFRKGFVFFTNVVEQTLRTMTGAKFGRPGLGKYDSTNRFYRVLTKNIIKKMS